MSIVFVDTSCLAAVALGESSWRGVTKALARHSERAASSLLEAELRSATMRAGVMLDPALLAPLTWITPDRSLGREIDRILAAGHLRGANCFHLACALYFDPFPHDHTFLTLDLRQRSVAKALGFKT